jgi:hypothetical protein
MRKVTRRKLRCEMLEGRWMMAGNITSSITDGVLTLSGDQLDNLSFVNGTGVPGQVVVQPVATNVDGTPTPKTFNGITSLVINGNDGNDQFSMQNLAVTDLTIDLGNGNDFAVTATQFGPNSVSVTGDLNLLMGAGNDVVQLFRVFGDPSADLTVDAGNGNDFLQTYSNSFDTVTIDLGQGFDTLNTAYLTAFGVWKVNGGTESDLLSVITSSARDVAFFNGNDAADNLAFNANEFRVNVTLDGGAGNDTVSLRNSIVLHAVFARLGDGLDTANFQNNSAREVHLDAGRDRDIVTLNANAVDLAILLMGEGDDDLTVTNNLVRNYALLDGGLGINRLTRSGNAFKAFDIVNFQTIV